MWLSIEVDGKKGLVDADGRVVVAPDFDFVRAIGAGRAFVRRGDESFILSASGERVCDVDARVLMPTREDRTPFLREGRWGFLDGEGREVVPPTFDSVFVGFVDGVVRVQSGGRQRLVDRDGQDVLPDAREIRQSPRGGLVPFMGDNKKWGLFSVTARDVVVEPAFADIFGLHGEHWILKKSAKAWGAANAAGEIVIPPKLPWLNAITEDRGATRNKSGRVGFVDGGGAIAIEHRFESRGRQDDMSRFSDGRCGVQLDGKIGFIDPSGELRVPPRFVNGFFYGEGRGAVVDEGGWTYVDEAGEPITEERFDRAETFASGIGVVSRGALKGALNRHGALVVPVACSGISVVEGVLEVTSGAGHKAYYRRNGSCIWKHAELDLQLSPALA